MGNPIHKKCGSTTVTVWTQTLETVEFDFIGKQTFIRETPHLHCNECQETVCHDDLVPYVPVVMDEIAQAVYDRVHEENPWLPSYR